MSRRDEDRSELETIRVPPCPGIEPDEMPILVSLYAALDAATRPAGRTLEALSTEELELELLRRRKNAQSM